MAKIRSIKPEFWESEQVGECHPMARLLFICLLNFCDDGGNYPASVKAMNRNAFGYDEVSADQVQGWMDDLIANGLVAVYEAEGKAYWHVTGFTKHQTIGRPFLKYPPFPSQAMPEQCSSIAQTMSKQCSDNVQAMPKQCSSIAGKGKEMERKGKDMKTERIREAQTVDNSARAPHHVDNVQNQKQTTDGKPPWWKSNDGILRMAKTLGVELRAGESFRDLKSRCFDEKKRREQEAA